MANLAYSHGKITLQPMASLGFCTHGKPTLCAMAYILYVPWHFLLHNAWHNFFVLYDGECILLFVIMPLLLQYYQFFLDHLLKTQ